MLSCRDYYYDILVWYHAHANQNKVDPGRAKEASFIQNGYM